MAKVLIFNTYLKKGKDPVLTAKWNTSHEFHSTGPARWLADTAEGKHTNVLGYLKRSIAAIVLLWQWLSKYDFLIVDSCMTGLMMSALSLFCKGNRRLIVGHFNLPHHKGKLSRLLSAYLFRRIDHFVVHSRYEIKISSQLYGLRPERFTFCPFARISLPDIGEPDAAYSFDDKRPFVLSFGATGRDYKTFLDSICGTDLSAVVVAREWNLRGLSIPHDVRAFCNVPMNQLDRMVHKCLFTVFAFDGSEPGCGHISIVTSFMLGKPVICTDWAGARDYVNDGENGVLVKMRDVDDLREAMLRLASDNDLYNRLSEGAHRWARENTNPIFIQRRIVGLVTQMAS
jgi:glycosyltransferase involved in cell wall biosynthesis